MQVFTLGTDRLHALAPSSGPDWPIAHVVARAAAEESVGIPAAAAPGLVVRIRGEGVDPSLAWLTRHREAGLATARALADRATAPLVIWPAVGDAFGDVPSVLSLIRADGRGAGVGGAGGWSCLVDPWSLLTPEMMPTAADHLERIFEGLVAGPACWGVVLRDPAAAGAGGGSVADVQKSSDLLMRQWQRHRSAVARVVVPPGDVGRWT